MAQRTGIRLEAFPVEIKTLIMCSMSDAQSLKSLVHASPDYHQAYLTAREEIFHRVVLQSLHESGIGIVDPWVRRPEVINIGAPKNSPCGSQPFLCVFLPLSCSSSVCTRELL